MFYYYTLPVRLEKTLQELIIAEQHFEKVEIEIEALTVTLYRHDQ